MPEKLTLEEQIGQMQQLRELIASFREATPEEQIKQMQRVRELVGTCSRELPLYIKEFMASVSEKLCGGKMTQKQYSLLISELDYLLNEFVTHCSCEQKQSADNTLQ